MSAKSRKLLNISHKVFRTALFLAAFFLIYCLILASKKAKGVIFLDVGQGDASLIKTPNGRVVLLDGGPDNRVLWGLGKNLPFYRRRIDFLVLSHYHDDHITGLIEVIKRYRVGTLIFSGESSDSLLMRELWETARRYGVKLQILDSRADLTFGSDCNLSLLNSAILGVKKDPNNSLAARFDCRGRSFLFSGDNGSAVEKILSVSGWPLAADVFKASHHGSNTSNSLDFLEKVAPRLIVVSVGEENRFGHPGVSFLERAASLGIPLERTDQTGEARILVR